MFQFRRFPSIRYGLAYGWLEFVQPGFPIQTSTDQRSFASPRGFSQLITSFFGAQCQGIHPALFFALPLRCIALHLSLIIKELWFVCFSDVLIYFINQSLICMKFSRYNLYPLSSLYNTELTDDLTSNLSCCFGQWRRRDSNS